MSAFSSHYDERRYPDRPWRDYPIGTLAYAVTGGHWTRVANGWKWAGGSTFPTPGGDAVGRCIYIPKRATDKSMHGGYQQTHDPYKFSKSTRECIMDRLVEIRGWRHGELHVSEVDGGFRFDVERRGDTMHFEMKQAVRVCQP